MKDMCHDHMCAIILVNLYHFISMEIRNDGYFVMSIDRILHSGNGRRFQRVGPGGSVEINGMRGDLNFLNRN